MSCRPLALRSVLLAALIVGFSTPARAQAGSAYSLSDVVELVRNHVPAKRVLALATDNCISFSLNAEARERLKRAGASATLLSGLKDVCGPDNPKRAAVDTAVAAPAPAPAPAPPPAPVDTTFPVKIRAAVIDANLTVRPLPQLDLYIISPKGDTTRTSTDLDGAAEGTFREGVYRIESARAVTVGSVRYHWAFYQPFTKDMRSVELTPRNAIVDTIPAPVSAHPAADSGQAAEGAHVAPADSAPAPAAPAPAPKPQAPRVYTEHELFEKYRSGLFTVYGTTLRGSGFLADSAGLVVTNAHLVKGALEVRVQLDSATKVYARTLVEDDSNDVAVLAIAPTRCAACAVLPLAVSAADSAPGAGQRVLALGSPLNRLAVLSIGIISTADDRSVVSDASVNWLNTGGPLVSLGGKVIALNSTRESAEVQETVGAGPRVATSVAAPIVAAALSRARDSLSALAAHPVSDSLLPVLPADPFPTAPIAAVSALPQLDLRNYKAEQGPFRMLVMTPQVMAWRARQAELALADRKQRDPRKAAQWRHIDPIDQWRDWRESLEERWPAVVVNVVPQQTEFPFYEPDKLQTFDAGNFLSMKIYRDGVEIVPVEKVRAPAVLNTDEMRASGRVVPMQGIYVYRIRDFAPRAVGTTANYSVTIVDAANPARPVSFPLSAAMIEQLWKDFTAYRVR